MHKKFVPGWLAVTIMSRRPPVDRGWLQNPQAAMYLTTIQMMEQSRVLGILSKKMVVPTPTQDKKVKSFLESSSSESGDVFLDPMDFMGKTKSMPTLSLRQNSPVIATGALPNASNEWKVRLHGESNTGKTSLSKALCRLSTLPFFFR